MGNGLKEKIGIRNERKTLENIIHRCNCGKEKLNRGTGYKGKNGERSRNRKQNVGQSTEK